LGRGRKGEEGITIEYLNRLSEYYENFIENYKNEFEISRIDNNTENKAYEVASSINELCKNKFKK
jgi:deoxyadenosine/deoxycytidine kinase